MSVAETAAYASTVVIDFESVGGDSCFTLVGQTFSTQGFVFSQPLAGNSLFTCNGSLDGRSFPGNGSRNLVTRDMVMQQLDGAPFDLLSFDLASEFPGNSAFDATVVVTGTKQGGGTVTASYSTAGSLGFQTISLNSAFSNLASVEFANVLFPNQVFFMDNITVSVPEPASQLMLLVGLVTLAMCRRSPAGVPARPKARDHSASQEQMLHVDWRPQVERRCEAGR
jgi:hypothetical protein